jgi:hypothetical protein
MTHAEGERADTSGRGVTASLCNCVTATLHRVHHASFAHPPPPQQQPHTQGLRAFTAASGWEQCECSTGPIGYVWSYLACRIGKLVPIWQPCTGPMRVATHGGPAALTTETNRTQLSCMKSRMDPIWTLFGPYLTTMTRILISAMSLQAARSDRTSEANGHVSPASQTDRPTRKVLPRYRSLSETSRSTYTSCPFGVWSSSSPPPPKPKPKGPPRPPKNLQMVKNEGLKNQLYKCVLTHFDFLERTTLKTEPKQCRRRSCASSAARRLSERHRCICCLLKLHGSRPRKGLTARIQAKAQQLVSMTSLYSSARGWLVRVMGAIPYGGWEPSLRADWRVGYTHCEKMSPAPPPPPPPPCCFRPSSP